MERQSEPGAMSPWSARRRVGRAALARWTGGVLGAKPAAGAPC
ncbi:hypothetical protein [Sorangium sp. So ce1078]